MNVYEIVKKWLQNWKDEDKKIMILHGKPGVGKTYTVYKVANEFGYDVVEFNASEDRRTDFMSKLKLLLTTKSLLPQLVLLDEADNFVDIDMLFNVLRSSKKPVFLTANNIRRLAKLSQIAEIVYVPPPDLTQIVKIAKENGATDLSGLRRDFRQGKLKVWGSQGYTPHDLEMMWLKGEYEDISTNDVIVLLDNIKKLDIVNRFLFTEAIRVYDLCRREEVLYGCKGRGPLSESYFFKKLLQS